MKLLKRLFKPINVIKKDTTNGEGKKPTESTAGFFRYFSKDLEKLLQGWQTKHQALVKTIVIFAVLGLFLWSVVKIIIILMNL